MGTPFGIRCLFNLGVGYQWFLDGQAVEEAVQGPLACQATGIVQVDRCTTQVETTQAQSGHKRGAAQAIGAVLHADTAVE